MVVAEGMVSVYNGGNVRQHNVLLTGNIPVSYATHLCSMKDAN